MLGFPYMVLPGGITRPMIAVVIEGPQYHSSWLPRILGVLSLHFSGTGTERRA